MKINKNDITATTVEGVREQVIEELQYIGCITADSDEEVFNILRECGAESEAGHP